MFLDLLRVRLPQALPWLAAIAVLVAIGHLPAHLGRGLAVAAPSRPTRTGPERHISRRLARNVAALQGYVGTSTGQVVGVAAQPEHPGSAGEPVASAVHIVRSTMSPLRCSRSVCTDVSQVAAGSRAQTLASRARSLPLTARPHLSDHLRQL
jgi:hypothetical protein